jgi:hypothetical protein
LCAYGIYTRDWKKDIPLQSLTHYIWAKFLKELQTGLVERAFIE